MMRRLMVMVGVLIGSVGLLGDSHQVRDAETLFQSALYKEQVELKLQEAIAGYKDVVAAAGADRATAAKALLRMAGCYERLGDATALPTYQRIVNEYGGLGAVADSARMKVLTLEQQGTGLVLQQVTDRFARFVSPDGRYLTGTDWNSGNIVVRDLRSGQHRLLTTEGRQPQGSYGQWPMPSPDSRLIAYQWFNEATDNSEFRVVSRDGGAARVIYRNAEPSTHASVPYHPMGWTPDGKTILAAFRTSSSTAEHYELAFVPIDGGPKKLVKRFESAESVAFGIGRLSPDGRSVAYHRDSAPEADLVCLSVGSGRETVIAKHPADDNMLAWVPDSQRILFLSDRGGSWGMWSVSVSDCQQQGTPVLIRGGLGEIWAQGFTQSGDFYFSSSGDSEQAQEVFVASLDANTGKQVGTLEPVGGRFVGNKEAADWSPDGDQIAYLTPTTRALNIRTVSTGADRFFVLPLFNMHNPAWFPDGKTVVLQGSDRATRDGLSLHLVNTTTGAVTAVTGAAGRRPVATRDALMYVARERGIVTRDLTTGSEQIIDKDATNFTLSPDGRWLAVLRRADDGGPRLTVMSSAGGDSRTIARVDGSWNLGRSLTWSADGRFIYATRRAVRTEPRLGEDSALEIWRIPADGREPTSTGIIWPGNISRISVHPDGKRLAISTSRNASATWLLRNIPGVRRR